MPYRLNNTWQFIHPDFGGSGSVIGIQTTGTGKVSMVCERESIRQSILLLISTTPGERVMRPKYGCNLQKLVFMPNDTATHGLAIHYVRTALERWEPRIDIINIDANANVNSPNMMEITLTYRIRHLQENEQFEIAYHLMGADV